MRADELELDGRGARFTAAGIEIETPLLGDLQRRERPRRRRRGVLLDVDDEAIAEGVRAVTGVPGPLRGDRRGSGVRRRRRLLAQAGRARSGARGGARRSGDGRLIVVFGAGGDRDRTKRPEMGRVARELADRVIVTNDNPRSEDPLAIIEEILQGAGTDVEIDLDRRLGDRDRHRGSASRATSS